MNDYIKKITDWIKANKMIALIAVIVLIALMFGKQLKRLLFYKKRRKHRLILKPGTKSGRSIPRSVGTRAKGKGYPAPGGGTIPYKYNKDGTIKKAWQVGGTLAAKNRMRRLRKSA